MSVYESRITAPAFEDRGFSLTNFRSAEPTFYALAVLLAAAMLPTGFAALVDMREFNGVGVWEKPFKFELALVIYLLTLVFFARFLPLGTTERRWYRIYAGVAAGAMLLEMTWIAAAAGLGTASHFNTSPMGAAIYSLAGLGAVILTTPPAVYAVLIWRNRQTGLSPALKESLVLGLGLVLPLTLVTAGTMAQMGGHEVGGIPGDANSLFLMGWSREGGDLRVAHFFATHALHVIPLVGLLVAGLAERTGRMWVRLAAVAYVGFVGWTFIQALEGRPFLAWIG